MGRAVSPHIAQSLNATKDTMKPSTEAASITEDTMPDKRPVDKSADRAANLIGDQQVQVTEQDVHPPPAPAFSSAR